jgi:hypothetical protein
VTIPPMEVPPSRATNAALPLPLGTDVDLSVDPDDPKAERANTPPSTDDSPAADQEADHDR